MVVLFQGDSITDAGRAKDKPQELGGGYAAIAASHLMCDNADIVCYNRGISGNRIVDVYARMKKDIVNLKPDVMSLLIGVNDIWHDYSETPNGVDVVKFEKIYRLLLDELRAEFPNLKLMILGAYLVKGSATEEIYDTFRHEVELRADAARRIAADYGAVYVPLQDKFDAAVAAAPDTVWTRDGVHPYGAGCALIARAWLDGFAKLTGR